MLTPKDVPPEYFAINASSSKPVKYAMVNGVILLNRAYIRWQKRNLNPTTLINAQSALPIISTMEDYNEYNITLKEAGLSERLLSETTTQVFENIEDNEYLSKVGTDAEDLFNSIQKIFSFYEIPIGFISMLYKLEALHCLDFVIDDANVNKDVLSIPKKGQSPKEFINEANAALDKAFASTPTVSTTYYEAIKKVLDNTDNSRVANYFLFTSMPISEERKKITKLIFSLKTKFEKHPLSLICFDEDSNESWNGNLHGIPFFTYVESFSKKRDKVLKDQGVGIPFSKGFYLMSQLLSLLNPKSLGAMHEVNYGLLVKGTAPFT
ncbi:hypothetical protein HK099_005846 [Clydaea vesicula]|uniref:Uncharacterized protein n=1 Tax=Clydaea vesicula TaxID=447962 RepID=A0AAD5TYY4_9FUNG|nr:hypothetical protein HK099_005846 [Clydaea vesicula]